MSRNRKSQSAGIRFGPALKAFLLCALFCGSGLGYVWQKDQIDRLAKQIRIREQRLESLKHNNEELRSQLAKVRMPQSLVARVKEMNLGLVSPAPGQVWTLPEPTGDAPRAEREKPYLAKDQ
jgi:hypothetical protein